MHIGFVEKGYPSSSGGGGAGTFVQVMGRYLVRMGHKVTVVASTSSAGWSEEADCGVRVIRLPVGRDPLRILWRLPGFGHYRHVARYLRRGKVVAAQVDRCHSESPFDLVEYSEGGDFWHRRRRSFKLISHLHGSRYTFLKQSGRTVESADWRQRRLELSFIHGADLVMSPSRALSEIVEQESTKRLNSLIVRPYPLDATSATSEPPPLPSRDPMRVIFAARNDPVKGGEVLLNAVNRIGAEGGGIVFDFFGYVPEPDHLLPASVRVHGFVRREVLLERYREADVAVVPSFWDNSPNTVYEAMASGLPVIGSSVGGIPELVRHGETGFLVEPRDEDGIVKRLLELRDNTAMRVKMGTAARRRIMELADPEPNLRSRLKDYQMTLAGTPTLKEDTVQ